MNAHIWEVDGWENENGRRMKGIMNDQGLQIFNCVWEGLSEANWFMEEKHFTLDYVCIGGSGLRKVVGACVPDRGEVIESDHAAIRVEVEWKGMMRPCKKKREKEKENEQANLGRVWQMDEWEGVLEYV